MNECIAIILKLLLLVIEWVWSNRSSVDNVECSCGCILLQITIETYLGHGFMGDVAVDDIFVASGGCAIRPSDAGRKVTYISPSTYTHTELPPTTPSPSPYDCFFDTDLCSWSSNTDEVRAYFNAIGVSVRFSDKLCVSIISIVSNVGIVSSLIVLDKIIMKTPLKKLRGFKEAVYCFKLEILTPHCVVFYSHRTCLDGLKKANFVIHSLKCCE